jgi:glycosyltransferase involved in cell wall biosynthesis
MARIRKLAGPNVSLLGFQNDAVLLDHLRRARAFIFAAEEDFGILPVEAQACGTPVIAFGKGGALETVVGLNNTIGAKPTGVFFDEQTVPALLSAIARFEAAPFDPHACRAWAEGFNEKMFRAALQEIAGAAYDDHHAGAGANAVSR